MNFSENNLATNIIQVAIDLHRSVGPGLLESVYENALAYDLKQQGFIVKQQEEMPFIYKEVFQKVGYRVDLIINNKIIIEVKSVERLASVHYSQLLTYLKLSDLKLGLLINFNSKLLKDGIHRVVNRL